MRSRLTLRGMRAVQFTIIGVMLAVPASALAFTSSAGAGRTDARAGLAHLPMRVPTHAVAYGRPIHVTGHARAATVGERVVLQTARTARSPWHAVASTHLRAGGRFGLWAHLRHSGLLRTIATDASAARPAAQTPTFNGGVAEDVRATVSGKESAVSRVAPIKVAAAIRVARRTRTVRFGHDLAVSGRVLPGDSGRRVAVQAHGHDGWQTVDRARTRRAGRFVARFAAPAGPNRELRVVFAGDRANAGVTTSAGRSTLYEPTVASWYDDAGDTACGFHATYGVANKSLPCGTKVEFRSGGRSVVATVDDRGPYVYGRTFDLNQNTAAALGFAGVGTVEASVQ